MTFVSIIRQEGGGGGGGFFHFLSCPRKTLARAPSSNSADRLPCVYDTPRRVERRSRPRSLLLPPEDKETEHLKNSVR